jgi:hypothetical protein
MDDITLRRLEALIATATNLPAVDGKYSEEARTNAIRAAFIIKENNLLDVLKSAKGYSAPQSVPPKPSYTPPPPAPKPPPIDLEKLHFRNVFHYDNGDLVYQMVNRFTEHLKYKAKSNIYPIYSLDQILHIAITTNSSIKNSILLKSNLRLELKYQVDYGCLDSRRGRNGGYFLKKI